MQAISKIYQANRSAAKVSTRSKPATSNPTKSQYIAVAGQVVPGFEIDDYNRELTRLLYAYATRDSYFTEQGYCLDKGLLLYGNVGSGKTGQLKTLQRVLNLMPSPFAFAYTTVSAVADNFGGNGFEAFLQYGQRHWLFDELGRLDRETVQYFGNKVNVAESLVQNRYELFTRGFLSHFTTNLSLKEMEGGYDDRVWSRLQEMCNLVKATAPDRRPTAKAKPLYPELKPVPVPVYTDAMKKETILQQAEAIRQGQQVVFLDTGGIHYQYLLACQLIDEAAYAEAEAEELVRMIANAKVTDLDTQSRKALKEFIAAQELPSGNKYTKELSYRVEKRLLKETIEKIAHHHLTF